VVIRLYYTLVRSLDELLGDDGVLRLPKYLPEAFVVDENRLNAIKLAVTWIRAGKNVLIEGSPGTGKTALMFMILKQLASTYRIGYINEGATSIGREHIERGVIIFYDDIPRMNRGALKSIIKHNIGGIIATARTEEAMALKRLSGIDLYSVFNVVKIAPLSDEKIEIMLRNYLASEAIRIEDESAIKEVVKKASGLPVYVWQVVRELKIMKKNLTIEYARAIPTGMLDYIDDILWRVLGGVPERYEALITLLIMTDFLKYSIHQDLYNYIYLLAKEKRLKKKLTLDDILLDPVIEDITRYLAKDKITFSFRLPHDSWADVLRGRSSGPIAPEISKINARYNYDVRRNIVIEAARRAWHESTSKTNDIMRMDAFKNNIRINYGEDVLKDILSTRPEAIKEAPQLRQSLPEVYPPKMPTTPETIILKPEPSKKHAPVTRAPPKPPIVPITPSIYPPRKAIRVNKICGKLTLPLYLICMLLWIYLIGFLLTRPIYETRLYVYVHTILLIIYSIEGIALFLTGAGLFSVRSILGEGGLGSFCALTYFLWGASMILIANAMIFWKAPPTSLYVIFSIVCGILTITTFRRKRPREGFYAGFLILMGFLELLIGLLGLVLLSIALLRIDVRSNM